MYKTIFERHNNYDDLKQKRNFLKEFKNTLKNYPKDAIYVDLFGGSGVLSHTVKSVHQDATVIYNDYDDYHKRLKNIPKTNFLLRELRNLLEGYPKDKKVSGSLKQNILKVITKHNDQGYVDFITISSSLRLGMNYDTSIESLQKGTYYNCIRKNDYLIW